MNVPVEETYESKSAWDQNRTMDLKFDKRFPNHRAKVTCDVKCGNDKKYIVEVFFLGPGSCPPRIENT